MRTTLGRIIFGVLVASLMACGSSRATAAEKIRVLIVDGQNNHNWVDTSPYLKKVLEASGRFVVDIATTPPRPNSPEGKRRYQGDVARYRQEMARFRPNFGRYDVVLSNYNGDAWPEATQNDLEEFVANGKGLVIIHAANNAFRDWKEFNLMIGMGWRDNRFGDRLIMDDSGKIVRVPRGKGPGSSHGPRHEFQVVIRNPDHPVTRGMPRVWMHAKDELYHGMRGPALNITLLATAFSDKAKRGTGAHEPMIWTVSYGKGRIFHTPMGHVMGKDMTAMYCVGFVTTVLRGTEWAATGNVTIPIPKDFPTATQSRLVKIR